VHRATALEDVDTQLPVETDRRMDTQRGGGRLMAGSLWATQKHRPFTRLRTDLQAAQLFLPSLGQPRHDGAGGIGFDELLGHPEALCGKLGLDPYQLPLVQPLVDEAREVRAARRSNDNDLAAVCNHPAERRSEQAPLQNRRLGRQHLGHRPEGPATSGQLCI
jgi:hypothetical protein